MLKQNKIIIAIILLIVIIYFMTRSQSLKKNKGSFLATTSSDDVTWVLNSSAPNKQWVSIAISSDGQCQTVCSIDGFIYNSIDYGVTWVPNNTVPNKQWVSIAISSDGQYQTVCSIDGFICNSIDRGVTWTVNNTAPNKQWISIAMSSDGQYQTACPANGNDNIYNSTDSGMTWVQNSLSPSLGWWSVTMSSDGLYQTACSSSNGSSIYNSTDRGVTWVQNSSAPIYILRHDRFGRLLPIFTWVLVVMSGSGKYQTACNSNGDIYNSVDRGVTWELNSSILNEKRVSISMLSDGQYQIICSISGNIYNSTNGGVTWNLDSSFPNKPLSSIAMSADGQYQTICSFDGTVYNNNKSFFLATTSLGDKLTYNGAYTLQYMLNLPPTDYNSILDLLNYPKTYPDIIKKNIQKCTDIVINNVTNTPFDRAAMSMDDIVTSVLNTTTQDQLNKNIANLNITQFQYFSISILSIFYLFGNYPFVFNDFCTIGAGSSSNSGICNNYKQYYWSLSYLLNTGYNTIKHTTSSIGNGWDQYRFDDLNITSGTVPINIKQYLNAHEINPNIPNTNLQKVVIIGNSFIYINKPIKNITFVFNGADDGGNEFAMLNIMSIGTNSNGDTLGVYSTPIAFFTDRTNLHYNLFTLPISYPVNITNINVSLTCPGKSAKITEIMLLIVYQ